MIDNKILKACVAKLHAGGVIAYPTEAVFGLGCDPNNQQAIQKILNLKQRDMNKGFIVIASSVEQLKPFIDIEKIPSAQLDKILSTWPGPFTWIFPAKPTVSALLLGTNNTLAVRVTAHPIAKEICWLFGGAIVSTSANVSTKEPARNVSMLRQYFNDKLDFIVEGELGGLSKPTEIRDALTNQLIRNGGAP